MGGKVGGREGGREGEREGGGGRVNRIGGVGKKEMEKTGLHTFT